MATRIGLFTTDGDYQNTSNWKGGVVPIAGDDVIISGDPAVAAGSHFAIASNLNQSAVALASFTVLKRFPVEIGTSSAYLQIASALVDLNLDDGLGNPTPAGRQKFDFGSSTAAAIRIYDSAAVPTDVGLQPLRILAAKNDTDVTILGGMVGIAQEPGETATIRHLDVLPGNGTVAPAVICGDGVTYSGTPKLTQSAGSVLIQSAHADVTVTGGLFKKIRSGDLTALSVYGGRAEVFGRGSVTTATMRAGDLIIANEPASGAAVATLDIDGGFTDLTRSAAARTITTLTMSKAARLRINTALTTLTNGIAFGGRTQVTARAA